MGMKYRRGKRKDEGEEIKEKEGKKVEMEKKRGKKLMGGRMRKYRKGDE